jgi:simple sugar transport system ATP-binding protein
VLPGEVHCLVGENGCGKSTMIKLASGVHEPDPGSVIEIDGQVRDVITPALAKSLGVQVIFQDLSLFPNLSVAENIAIDEALGTLAKPVPWRQMRRIADEALKRLGLALPLDAQVSSLSIASRQIVAIARGIAAEARLLFMDEPTASLTRTEVRRLIRIVERLKADGIAVVFVSHRLEEVVEIAERVTVMRDGHKVGTWPIADLDIRRIGELMTGRVIDTAVTARDRSAESPVLEVNALTRQGEYENISFQIHKGEIVGLTGLLGAGRTELALSLFGMTEPDSGSIALSGRPVRLASNRAAIRANLTATVLRRLASALGILDPEVVRSTARSWVERLRIKIPGLENPVNQLSGGNQQRVVIGKWLATEPRLLILDSPTVGVDIGNKQSIYQIARNLAGEGVAILMISDEIGEVYNNADRVLHMRGGRIVGEYDPRRVDEKTISEAVYA